MTATDEFRECFKDLQAYFNRMLVKYPTNVFMRALCMHVACVTKLQEKSELAGEWFCSEMMDILKNLKQRE